jgi:hypothetical protein
MVFAQAPAKRLTERKKMIFKVNQKIEPGVIFEFLKKCDKEIQQGINNNKPLSALRYSSLAASVKTWLEYRWFTADTELSKTWFKKIYKLLAYMSNTKRYMQTAKFNGRTKTEKYKKAGEYCDVAYKRFVKLIRKPVRAPDGVIQKAQVEKDMWQRRMRKKYNIKESSWYDF